MADRPRIQFLVDRPRHAQARTARAISRALSAEYHCRVRYETERPDLLDAPFDLLVVMSWDGTWHRRFGIDSERVVKSVLDHGWSRDNGGPSAHATEFAFDWLHEAATVTCCSERLRAELADARPDVRVTRPGFDPFVFPYTAAGRWHGPTRFGWAGDRSESSLGYEDVLEPALSGRSIHLLTSEGSPQLAAIGAFFRSIDVFVLASEHEGAPLTLVEAIASGCFPVCVDVGVVPEWVEHGETGLVVPRDPDAFRDAFAWCARHPQFVRRAGARGAERVRNRLTWGHVADDWRAVFDSALERVDRVRYRNGPVLVPVTPRRRAPSTPRLDDVPSAFAARCLADVSSPARFGSA